ncbi:MAG: NUDIX pyrophosphatase [Candidatus Nanoarchaeia archaeon]|nr:NUDIX pyrophosphatase [Candidatus Nanoarchaeia archaeon]
MVKVEVILFRKTGKDYQFLLLKRTKEQGGYWQPITGTKNGNESTLQAALREAFEEAGLNKKNILKEIKNFYEFDLRDTKEHVFGFQVKNNFEPDIKSNKDMEHEEYRWLEFKSALNLLFWEENKKALIRLNEIL